MKAQELRIGNYIFSKETQKHQIIVGVTLENPFIDAITFDYTTYNEIEPIPLTEQCLIDFGFEKHQSNPFWFRRGFMCISLVGKVELITWDHQIFKIEIGIKHVHQLQNLYFALTGEDLHL